MAWEVKPGGKKEKPPAGNHLAILVGLLDMGEQWQEPFDKTKEGYWQWRCFFVWELCGEQIAGTKRNHVIGVDLTMSVDERSKLHKWVLARTGKPPATPFDPTTELGQPSFLNVVMKGDFPRVDGMAMVPKGIPVPTATYPLTAISLEEFREGKKPIPDWCPWFYGSPLDDHIRACRQIGDDKPKPRKGSNESEQPSSAQPGNSDEAPPDDGGNDEPDPHARWDYHNGEVWVTNATTADLNAYLQENHLDASKVFVKPAGLPREGAKRGNEFGFGFFDVIPF